VRFCRGTWQNATMPSPRSTAPLVAQLRALAPRSRRRAAPAADVAALLGTLLGASRGVEVEDLAGGVAFRFVIDGERLTCLLHAASPAPLTAAEAAVAELVCDGRTLAQIAQRRGVSVNTVKSQLRQVFRKLEVDSRVALVRRLAP
jgi:DNA-binding CsgD family transcriptional regulator